MLRSIDLKTLLIVVSDGDRDKFDSKLSVVCAVIKANLLLNWLNSRREIRSESAVESDSCHKVSMCSRSTFSRSGYLRIDPR